MVWIFLIIGAVAVTGIYMISWSGRMMPGQAEVREAQAADGGKILKIGDFHIWTKCIGQETGEMPIVFIPGGMGLKSAYLEDGFRELRDTNPLIFYDPRGCGRSESKKELTHYQWKKFSEELYEIINQLSPDRKVILAAHSCGCAILYEFLRRHRDMVEKVILLSCMPLKYEAEMPNPLELIWHFPPKDPGKANRWFASYAKSKVLFGNMFVEKQKLEEFDTESMSMVMCTNINLKINKPYDYSGEFKDYNRPVLIMCGNDKWESVSTNRRCAGLLKQEFPDAKTSFLENSGHFFFTEEKEETIARVRAFVTEK